MTGVPAVDRSGALRSPAAWTADSHGDWRLALAEPRRRRLRIWMWALAGTTASVLMVDGITRLTHSGLSMVEWQPLVGAVPPLNEVQWAERFDHYRRFPEYQSLAGLIATQYLLGIATLLWRVPIGLAVAHQALALAIVGVWIAWVHHVRTQQGSR